ncbi:Repeat domain-containing protein [Dyadobacter koreensis]|uniref:Repeat domain-containing protein n=1 Tax=Dyadobacter koreensis TaxID=408657 RepID=A0A1H7BGT2_9BACT|nr:VCBS repeat-containing protein [Dyadobacter koreensis]SEJ72605.1 Repeat domain-containing protein [Dyadobacter koreensis]
MKFYYVIYLVFILASCKDDTLFEAISSSKSGIEFNNLIVENDSVNPLDMVNIYNGGGVGIGDFNNDGWPDIYFVGNRVSSRLYLNKGAQGAAFEFSDVTEKAGVDGKGRWGRGVAIVDINNDGWEDIYVCNTLSKDSLQRRNLLYVNQKETNDGIPVFKELAAEYGVDIHVQSTMANFFDYDNDGDLDMYLTVNEASPEQNPNQFGLIRFEGRRSMGRLFRNEWDAKLKHARYSDVSLQSGMSLDGFGHTATVVDLNQDGWKDISVANDFLSSNILYINNQNGTFTDRSRAYFKHTSLNAMGQDIGDINNDGLADLVELDMNPEDNYRKKMMMMANNYASYLNFDLYGYQYQYVRNTLQLNQGPRVGPKDSIGSPAFSEISFMSGIAQTDWSWTPLLTDFNNDGFRDLIVTNGYPKDVTDHDFIAYRDHPNETTTKSDILAQIPVVKIHNYAYQNTGDLTFRDVTSDWGFDKPTFSNGAVYADLDNDGALDIVINNINDKAFIYKNNARERDKENAHYLQLAIVGDSLNVAGLGTFVSIYYAGNKQQVYEHTPYRGYLSTNQLIAHFGLGKVVDIDSVVIKWPNGKKQILQNVKADQRLTVSSKNALVNYGWSVPKLAINALFTDVTKEIGLTYRHKEFDFIDFNIQKLLPHKLSEYSPGLAVGDVDGNGTDDLVIGGNAHDPAQIFLQGRNGKFIQRNAVPQQHVQGDYKDEGLLLFDANGDSALDLYIARGGYKNAPNSPGYQDKLYMNDGKGNFAETSNALPSNLISKFCVRAFDFNRDGKLDLFVSGRVEPWNYPKPVSSVMLRNDSKDGYTKFTDVTDEIAPALKHIGLVCDAIVTDFDNDTWPDLILVGEWMPITFFKNKHGRFNSVTEKTGVGDKPGWWNSIVAGDFRHTGRMDYIVGNAGLNTLFKASDQYPVYVTAKDFDNSGNYSAIPSLFLPDQNRELKEFPMHGREDLIKQMNIFKKKYGNFRSFALTTMEELLSVEQRKGAIRMKANMLQSCFLRNDGNGKFTLIPLPKQAQISILNGMVVEDYDGDGNLDVAITGNDYGTDVSIGRYDALNGLVLLGDGKGSFNPQSILQSGLYIPGNGKALVKLRSSQGRYMMFSSQNRDIVKAFELKRNVKNILLEPTDMSAQIHYKNGKILKQEFTYGSSFLSQSGRFLTMAKDVKKVIITDYKGHQRLAESYQVGTNLNIH